MPQDREHARHWPQPSRIGRRKLPTVSGVADDRPLVRLPDEVVLSRDEVATVLAALDVSEGFAIATDEPLVRGAIRLLTAKLWPELGDLLGDDEQ